jgi:hypothetical protein
MQWQERAKNSESPKKSGGGIKGWPSTTNTIKLLPVGSLSTAIFFHALKQQFHVS